MRMSTLGIVPVLSKYARRQIIFIVIIIIHCFCHVANMHAIE